MKKTLIVCITAVAIGILLTYTTVRAASGDTFFEGYAKNFVDIPHSYSLFGDFKNLYPGVSVAKNVEVHNADSQNVRIYLRARATKSEYIHLLQNISLSVVDDRGNVISTSENPAQNMLVCELSGGESRELKIRLNVGRQNDIDMISTSGKLDFIFSAEEFVNPNQKSVPNTDGNGISLIYSIAGIMMLSSVIIILFSREKLFR
ncbi:MAG: hypothetical protein IIT39_16710 [Clostridia bacterium]|nr:hypothetical protein [Clostridia bacterium]